ncbi:MAG: signal peptide peptidase SppA [Candidatus Caldarchaeales archaeon]
MRGLKWWSWLLIGLIIGSLISLGLVTSLQTTEAVSRLEYVALVEFSGTIAYSESPLAFFSGDILTPRDVEGLASQIRRDPSIKAVVLVINSPGGSAAASEEIYNMLKKLGEVKVLVSYITEYGASGGYYIALPSREIIASPNSLTGSIGAISIVVNWRELLDRLGVKSEIFKSGDLKDLGSGWRDMTDEERRIMMSIVDSIADVFEERVRQHRREKLTDWDEVLSARPYTGLQALQVGLIDGVGTLDYAVKRAIELAGLPEDTPTRWVRPKAPSILELLLGGSSSYGMKLNYEVLLMWPLPDFSSIGCSLQYLGDNIED